MNDPTQIEQARDGCTANMGLEPVDPSQKPAETAAAAAGFASYRDLPPARRSIRAAAEALHGPDVTEGQVRTMERWSSSFNWVRRAQEHDAGLDAVRLLEQVDAIRAAAVRHREIGEQVLDLVAESLHRWQAKLDADPDFTIPMRYIPSLMRVATDLERLSLDQPTEITKVLGPDHVIVTWGDEEMPELDEGDMTP